MNEQQQLEWIFLKIRNLIASKEFETALANRELNQGGWLSDHQHSINCIDFEIEKLMNEPAMTKALNNPSPK